MYQRNVLKALGGLTAKYSNANLTSARKKQVERVAKYLIRSGSGK